MPHELAISPPLREPVVRLAQSVEQAGGQAYLVGGCVRDGQLGLPSNEVDLEVFGLTPTVLENTLSQHFHWNAVGKAFGVYKIRHFPIDVSLPRRERKTGVGHRAFAIEPDPYASLAEAAARRDFTINAILQNPLSGELEDPLEGIQDLKERRLRHCSAQFSEDSLRVLRGMQFIARFNLDPDPETIALCREISWEDLPPERVFEEWKKLLLRGVAIGKGLRFLVQTGWIQYFSELEATVGCPQEPEWHPEGDVFTHTGHCLNAFARQRIGDEWEDLVVGFAVLCHDLGKPEVTAKIEGRIRSRGHPEVGVPIAQSFLERLTRQSKLIDSVLPLVREHHRPLELFRHHASDAAIRRLAQRVHRIDRLVRVAQADREGRPPLPGTPFPEGSWLLEKSHQLSVQANAPEPIIQGRHLIERGFSPSPRFKPILDACFEAQLDGQFQSLAEGEIFLDQYLKDQALKPE